MTMKTSDIIRIMKVVQKKFGNIDVVGECADCTTNDMDIYILTMEKGATKCYIQVSTPGEE